MEILKSRIPVVLAVAFGVLTLLGVLLIPGLGITLTAWASFLAAAALMLGILNLLGVHMRRLNDGNYYSLILIIGMGLVFLLAVTDWLNLTEDGVGSVFNLVQAPLEAAMASMLAIFLLFSGFRLLQRQRSWWALLFIVTVILLLLAQTTLPDFFSRFFSVPGYFNI